MKEQDEEKIRELLKTMRSAESELNRDLWPQMLRRLDAGPVRVPWYDWALVALVSIWCLLFPNALLGLIYHL